MIISCWVGNAELFSIVVLWGCSVDSGPIPPTFSTRKLRSESWHEHRWRRAELLVQCCISLCLRTRGSHLSVEMSYGKLRMQHVEQEYFSATTWNYSSFFPHFSLVIAAKPLEELGSENFFSTTRCRLLQGVSLWREYDDACLSALAAGGASKRPIERPL